MTNLAKPLIPEVIEPDEALPPDLRALRRFAWLLDAAVAIPGTRRRVGISAAVGLIPGVGDAVGAFLSGWIVIGAIRHRVPFPKVARMLVNIVIDALVGAVPVVGDIADILFKENLGNIEIVLRNRNRALRPRTTAELLLGVLLVMGFIAILGLGAIFIAVAVLYWILRGLV